MVLVSKPETDWLMAEAPAKLLHMRVHARTVPQTSTPQGDSRLRAGMLCLQTCVTAGAKAPRGRTRGQAGLTESQVSWQNSGQGSEFRALGPLEGMSLVF